MKNLSVLTILLMVFVFAACDKDSFDQDTNMSKILLQESSIESRNSEEELSFKLQKLKYMHLNYHADNDPFMYFPERYREEFREGVEYAVGHGTVNFLRREFKTGRMDRATFDELSSLVEQLESSINSGRLQEYIDDYQREATNRPNSRVATSISDNIVSGLAAVIEEYGISCSDGIQNGFETGVDCGGFCPPCGIVNSSCTDGIRNGDETSVDCGGFCPPCNSDDWGEIEERGCVDSYTLLGAITPAALVYFTLDDIIGESAAGITAGFTLLATAGIGGIVGTIIGIDQCSEYEDCTPPTTLTFSHIEGCDPTGTVAVAGFDGDSESIVGYQWTISNGIVNGISNPVELRTSDSRITVTALDEQMDVIITGGPVCNDKPWNPNNDTETWYFEEFNRDFEVLVADVSPVFLQPEAGKLVKGSNYTVVVYNTNLQDPNVSLNLSMSPIIGGFTDNGDGSHNIHWFSSGTTTITATVTNDCSGEQEADSITLTVVEQ